MTVRELKELLAEAPDDMRVYIGEEDDVLGGFKFMEACSIESGITGIGKPDPETGEFGDVEEDIFSIMSCGVVCKEESGDEDEDNEGQPPHPIFN